MNSFQRDGVAVVIGASGGIGAALAQQLEQSGRFEQVLRLSRSGKVDVTIDIENDESVAAAAEQVKKIRKPDLVIVATGLLHDEQVSPEKSLRAIDAAAMRRSFSVNTVGPALVCRHFLPLLPRGRKSVMAALSARVGSISDNRLGGWVSYRASKAALNQVIRTLAIELRRTHPEAILAGLHPGTVATRLSAPFQANVPERKLFTPESSARKLLRVIDRLESGDSGSVFAWDGKQVPA